MMFWITYVAIGLLLFFAGYVADDDIQAMHSRPFTFFVLVITTLCWPFILVALLIENF